MENSNKCTGRCEMCSPNQRSYCAAQKMLYAEQDIAEIKAMLKGRDNTINTIIAKNDIVVEDK